jgi:DNA-binding LytR/AlgR family response regulator
MKCVIIEDQAPAQRVLKKYISDIDSLELVETFNNAIGALEFLKTEKVDLLFLDIHLPKISGIDFLKSLANPPAVILTTAFSEYAVQSYELSVVDYLVKPFSFERFLKAISKVKAQESPSVKANKDSLEFYVKSGYELIKINSADVLYIQSSMDYTDIYYGDKKLLSQETLSYWEEKLQSHGYIRVHKSYLVNTAKIVKVAGNQIFLNEEKTIPIGRAYKENFLSKLMT